ncbi:MAG: substrate-binding domain-containing protein [Bacteroidales bacterium]|nr:substrate-binding domain-containing protein [Bacteroidales bacterium]
MIKILVLIDSSTGFSRSFLSGIIKYANERGNWSFYRLPTYYKVLYGEKGIIQKIKEWQINAVVAQWEYGEIQFLKELNIPVFLQNYKKDEDWFSKIAGNYDEVGAMAANFFFQKGYVNFAFYGDKEFFWSKGRAKGYKREVEKLNGNFFYFESEYLTNSHWSHDHIELSKWLKELPKPVALFACDDYFALQVSEICKIINILIPEQISLLGVDNDEFICNLSYPPISSIVTNDEEIGYNTGEILHRLILNNENYSFIISKKPLRIEERRSTEKYNTSDEYVTKIIEFIEKHITTKISIEQLTELVPLSRRSLENRFKKEMGITIYQFILDRKVDYISKELVTTNKNLLEIAIDVGYNDARQIFRVFKKNTGYTPSNYRKKFTKKS